MSFFAIFRRRLRANLRGYLLRLGGSSVPACAAASLVLSSAALWLAAGSARAEEAADEPLPFAVPRTVADGGSNRNYQLSRLSNSVLAFDPQGVLHLTYWRGDENSSQGTSPDRPSYVCYRSRSREGLWNHELCIDDSTHENKHVGGRHPTLTIDSAGRVWVVWHDYRHCTEAGGWQNNIEIYADVKPPGGRFSPADLRLTKTEPPAHLGDNGHIPRIAADPTTGRMSVAWYDFHFSLGQGMWDVTDIMLKTSDATGNFDLNEPIGAMRLTDAKHRGGVSSSDTPSYWAPDIAVDTSGTRHLIWGGGAWSAFQDLHYVAVPLGVTSVVETTVLATEAVNGFWDPPHLTLAPTGDLWVAYVDMGTPSRNVVLLRKRAGGATFDPPLILEREGRQVAPDLEIDQQGLVHLVYVHRRTDTDRDVLYASYDPETETWGTDVQLTSRAAKWERPCLALDSKGRPFIVFEENRGDRTAGDVWFTFQASGETAAEPRDWESYR